MNNSFAFAPKDLKEAAASVVKRCREEDQNITEPLAEFMLGILSISLEYQEQDKNENAQESLQFLSELVIKKLLEKHNPSVTTVKLHVHFHQVFQTASEFMWEQNLMLDRSIQWILHKILNFTCQTKQHYEILHSDITIFVIMQHKYDSKMFKEIEKAVSSVFPMSQIDQFLHFSQNEKTKYLFTLASVAVGIHLYKWYNGRRDHTMHNDAEIAAQSAPKLMVDFSNEFKLAEELIGFIEKRLCCFHLKEKFREEANIDLDFLQSYLEFLHMYKRLLQQVMTECRSMTFRIFFLRHCFQLLMKDIKSALSDSYMETLQLFSLYSKASSMWKALSYELLFLNSLLSIFQQMKSFKQECNATYSDQDIFDSFPNSKPKKEEETSQISSDSQLVEESNKSDVPEKEMPADEESKQDSSEKEIPNYRIITPECVSNFEEIDLKFQGFCPWSLVYSGGLLCKGDRQLGIVMVSDCCYAFSSVDRRDSFCKEPDLYITSIMDITRTRPQLLLILNLAQEFGIKISKKVSKALIQPVFISDCGSQTEVHPIKRKIDLKYRWNQWDLRKQAFQYLDLQHRQTHSVQTLKSHFRRENFSQVYLPKCTASQTKRDKCIGTTNFEIPEIVFDVKESIF